jgi:hypothetical protein
MEIIMTVAEFHAVQQHVQPESVSARWFTIAMIAGSAFLAFAALSYVLA